MQGMVSKCTKKINEKASNRGRLTAALNLVAIATIEYWQAWDFKHRCWGAWLPRSTRGSTWRIVVTAIAWKQCALALGVLALLGGCTAGDIGSGPSTTNGSSPPAPPPPATPPAVPPAPPVPPPTGTSGQLRVGSWRELIVNSDGTLNTAEYDRVAANYNSEEMLNYRLGPTYADVYPNPTETLPTIYQPEPNGLWKGGLNRALADKFCQTPDKLIQSDAPDGYGNGFGGGGGWQMSGQMLFLPDANAPSNMRAGSANMRAFDGARAARASDGSTQALCMRLRPEWVADWWNRNNISTPTTPAVGRLLQGAPNLPLPAVATARGQIQNSITGFLAFRNGVIAAAGTGNDQYCNGFGTGTACETSIQLPAGKVPTALALTAMNEFLFATVWDVNTRRGQLAVIAVGADDPSNVGLDAGRYGWGVQSWPGIRSLKLLGFVDLPMAAPDTLSVALSTGTQKFRGFEFWRGPELKTQTGRNEWNQRSLLGYDAFLPVETQWKALASAGYAVVGSRAEDKVALIDLRPLVNFYRTMYLTSQANFDQTANSNQGQEPNKWPFTFDSRPEQRPVVLGTLTVQQPTAVLAFQKRGGSNTLSGWEENNLWNQLGKRVTIASMDGTIRQFDVTSLVDPVRTPSMPTQPIKTWQSGFNPTQIAVPIGGANRTDDLYVVSRGARRVFIFNYKGDQHGVLADTRLTDPVAITIGPDMGGFGGSGKDLALQAQVLTILDFNGKTVHDYGFMIDNYPSRYQPGRLDSYYVEQWPYLGPDGRTVQQFQYGWGNPLPGKPFAYTMDEVI